MPCPALPRSSTGIVEECWRHLVFISGCVEEEFGTRSSLDNIVADLLPYYFVATNATAIQPSSLSTQRDLVSLLDRRPPYSSVFKVGVKVASADVLIFLLSEGSLGDKRSLMSLQYGWELMTPILLLRFNLSFSIPVLSCAHSRPPLPIRPARTKLLLQPMKHNRQAHNPRNSSKQPNLPLIRQLLSENYPHSIVYDRFNHQGEIPGQFELSHGAESSLQRECDRSESDSRMCW